MATFENDLIDKISIIKHLLDQLPEEVISHLLTKGIQQGDETRKLVEMHRQEIASLKSDLRISEDKCKKLRKKLRSK